VACVAHVTRGYVLLKAVIDELARRFATTSAGGTGRHRLRERTDELILDLLAALKTASLGEIADTTRALERRRKTRASERSTARVAAPSASGRARKGERSSDTEPDTEAHGAVDERPPAAPRDPFDITVPSELLEAPLATGGPPRAARKQTSDLLGISAPAPTRVEEPPRRTVSLREGEQLLRSGGAGAIIRRVRGS
jgi:hypothetical protein